MAGEASAFAIDGSAVISRQISRLRATRASRNVREYYEIDKCLDFITSNESFKKVALQFPDHLLCDSVAVVTTLGAESGRECVILGDTSYGSCCVDEVAAAHVTVNCIIHFGPSCLTQTQRLPVLYVFGMEEVDMEACLKSFRDLFPDPLTHVLILYDTIYHHCTAELKGRLSEYPHCTLSHISLPHPVTTSTEATPTDHTPSSVETRGQSEGVCCYERFGRCFKLDKPVEEYKIFYVGREGQTLSNLLISYSKNQFYSYDPATGERRRESVSVNKALGRRYYLVQKAKEAATVGILVGTLGAADSLKVIQRLKTVLREAGKKYYTVAVGKLNVAKMANFMEIDIFVLVACPENSLVESQEFYRPVVTPFEMEVACLRSREWSGEVITDFRELFSLPEHEQQHTEEEPEFSLITGSLLPQRPPLTDPERGQEEEEEGTVAVRANMDLALPNSTAAEFLSGRGWKGLERRLGEGGVASAAEGRRGVASAYSHEHST